MVVFDAVGGAQGACDPAQVGRRASHAESSLSGRSAPIDTAPLFVKF